jgi:hypothetical protein
MSCHWTYETGTCSGTAVGQCSDLTVSSDCDPINGCDWMTSPHCTGAPVPCSAPPSATACNAVAGCEWSTAFTCTGTPTPCDQLPVATCTSQSGCVVTGN